MNQMNWVERDLKTIWHPYTQMKTAKPPIAIVKGEGLYLMDADGRRYMDMVSSWWVNLHGHSHPYIAQKIAEQLHTLEHVIFAGFTHPKAIELAERLLSLTPNNQSKVFYSDNGSTAVEAALKMAFQYGFNQGAPRKKIVALGQAYHGDTFGAMAVSGRGAFTKPFEGLLFEVIHIDLPNKQNLKEIKEILLTHKEDIAAFIYEPLVQGAAGMRMYEAPYLDKLILFCKEQGIITIADEVMTGFGRTGKTFASFYLKEYPDIMCFSKGLTGGTLPLGITTCTEDIYHAFLSEDKLKTLFHGHSFTANPIACTAALASMDLFLTDHTQDQIQMISLQHKAFINDIRDHPKALNARSCGTILAIEWIDNKNVSSYFSDIRDTLYFFFLSRGIILRPLGNTIYLLPPYCITKQELTIVYDAVKEALESI